jgi:Family of unknown function (DUF6134)
MRLTLLLLTLLLTLLLPAVAQAAGTTWTFRVLLGDSDIGEHRFTLTEQGEQRTLRSEAAFAVKILGLTVYRYKHEATEQWAGDCLARLTAQTDDNGTQASVTAKPVGNILTVESPQGEAQISRCVMSFAYWNPAMLQQTSLLNAQNGRLESVRIKAVGDEPFTLRGQATTARHYTVEGLERPLQLWYSAQGDWLGLESTVTGGKRLRYVLQ